MKLLFDACMILMMAGLLSIVIYFGIQNLYISFSLIPLATFYFLGQYSQKKFGSFNKKTAENNTKTI